MSPLEAGSNTATAPPPPSALARIASSIVEDTERLNNVLNTLTQNCDRLLGGVPRDAGGDSEKATSNGVVEDLDAALTVQRRVIEALENEVSRLGLL